LIGILSIGIFVLPFAIAGTVFLARRSSSIRGATGIVSGLGLPPLYIAFLNRGGPGNVCTSIPGGQECSQELNPWLWIDAGLFFISLGVMLFVVTTRKSRGRDSVV